MTDRKRIAFINKDVSGDDSDNRARFEENGKILERLGEFYEVAAYSGLSDRTCKKLRQNCSSHGPYHGIVTHVPANPHYLDRLRMSGERLSDMPQERKAEIVYGSSIDLIKGLHESFPTSLIVAYTGADEDVLPDWKLKTHGIQHILRRSSHIPYWLTERDIGSDIEKIIGWINSG